MGADEVPVLQGEDTGVIDSRESDDGDSTRRRRQCESCGKRFTTYERVELSMRWWSRPAAIGFLRSREGAHRLHARAAQAPRAHRVRRAGDRRIEQRVLALGERELASRVIGEMVMRELKKMTTSRTSASPRCTRISSASTISTTRSARSRSPRSARAAAAMMFGAADREFMRQALDLAAHGLYTTTPNPRVGCVVVKDGAAVGTGWHEKAGMPHAEVLALKAAGELARGATLYVNLEPCSHHGRTPPCADA